METLSHCASSGVRTPGFMPSARRSKKGGWIVIAQITDGGISEPEGTFVGVWSTNDNGDVPPRWKIEGKASNVMKKPRGVALDPKHKEVIVSDMRLNAVLTFYFPEIF